MPTSMRTKRMMSNRRRAVRTQYESLLRTYGTPAYAVDTLSRIHNVSRATIYKDLQATRKEVKP